MKAKTYRWWWLLLELHERMASLAIVPPGAFDWTILGHVQIMWRWRGRP